MQRAKGRETEKEMKRRLRRGKDILTKVRIADRRKPGELEGAKKSRRIYIFLFPNINIEISIFHFSI